ncbi:MAG: hypothetical protein LBH44_06950 [Treponema sp.]|jgi:hypothetical protein|nr:hypothetical protein [Treponema sp.]
MNPAVRPHKSGQILLFLFFLISPLSAEPLFDEEPDTDEENRRNIEYLLSEEFLNSEEFLLSDDYLLFDESSISEEFFFDEDEETFLSGESLLNEEHEAALFSEETFFDEEHNEPFISEELFFDEGYESPLLSEESIFDEEYEATLLSEETFFNEEHETPLLSEDSVFEAPPLIFEVPRFIFEPRSFDALFPSFSQTQKASVFSNRGLRYSFEKDGSPALIPDPDSGIDILSSVMIKKPSHIIEVLVVVPYNERELEMLDLYNALGRIENIKDHSVHINGRDFNVFTETTRLVSAKNRKAVSDPPPADMLPYSETMYLRFKEVYFGNLFLRGDISMSLYGITYSITNFTDVRFLLLPVMKAERFTAILYLEPVKEGVLIYCMSGLYIPGFIADRVNITPSVNSRIAVLLSWITEGLRRQGN